MMKRTAQPRARRVAIIAFDGFQPLDVVGPFDVLHGANQALAAAKRKSAPYQIVVASPRCGIVRAENGLRIVSDRTLAGLAHDASSAPLDTVLVSGGAGTRAASVNAQLVQQLARAAHGARRVTSVCTGTFLLAAAGLLDGHRATTHWAFCEALAKRFPRVHVESDPIFIHDRARWTSAGVTAGIDLALALVEADHGREIALTVARWLVVFVRRAGGQSQFSPPLAAQSAERRPVRDVQTFIVEHPDADLEVPALAARAAMSVRNFSRVFRAETGASPAHFVETVRVDVARRLLEDTNNNVDTVSASAGFGTPEALRRAFARIVGLSPREYRARFGAVADA